VSLGSIEKEIEFLINEPISENEKKVYAKLGWTEHTEGHGITAKVVANVPHYFPALQQYFKDCKGKDIGLHIVRLLAPSDEMLQNTTTDKPL
jgi:hypothetical protein